MDTCGCISGGGYENHPRHEFGGPPGWGGFNQLDWPLKDQWTYHAVADVILAHSLIRSFKEVDPDRVGLTGISWGGYLACITAGVDSRFRFVAPVYGCGFLGENSAWLAEFQKLGPEKSLKWLGTWDPSVYLTNAAIPMLWLNGTCDFAYPMDSWRKSTRLPQKQSALCLRVNMPHGHGGPGENPEEIHVFADALLCGGKALPIITGQTVTNNTLTVAYKSPVAIQKAELNYTTNSGGWQKRVWMTQPAQLHLQTCSASAVIPDGATAFYINLTDARGLVASSEFRQMGEP
jgi:hypothetical protein